MNLEFWIFKVIITQIKCIISIHASCLSYIIMALSFNIVINHYQKKVHTVLVVLRFDIAR